MTGPKPGEPPRVPLPRARLIDPPPPFWGRWSRIYLLIAGLLLVETVLFWWLTRWAS